ncbi:MAG TPA: DUF4040 domain-containing protein [Marmoricola sp.]|nr:DUF4040 domain-containing protein [Marmoricola sp.]
MTAAILLVLLVMLGVLATATALTREPGRQALVFGGYGLVMGVTMLALQAPDVALSQITVGAAIVPLIVLLTVMKCGRILEERRQQREDQQ